MKSIFSWTKTLRWLVFSFAFYVLVYLFESLAGGYRFLPSGNFRPIYLSSPDTCFWQPRFGLFHPHRDISGKLSFHHDVLGGVFSPLILLDQKFLHKTIPAFTEELEFTAEVKGLAESQWHPLERERAKTDDEMMSQLAKARADKDKLRSKKLWGIRSEIFWLEEQADDYNAKVFGAVVLCLFLALQFLLVKFLATKKSSNEIVPSPTNLASQ